MAFRPIRHARRDGMVDVPGYAEPFDPRAHGWDGRDDPPRHITKGIMAAAHAWARQYGIPTYEASTAALTAWDAEHPPPKCSQCGIRRAHYADGNCLQCRWAATVLDHEDEE